MKKKKIEKIKEVMFTELYNPEGPNRILLSERGTWEIVDKLNEIIDELNKKGNKGKI